VPRAVDGPVPGARCPVPGARCPVPGARCPVRGARCAVRGAGGRCLVGCLGFETDRTCRCWSLGGSEGWVFGLADGSGGGGPDSAKRRLRCGLRSGAAFRGSGLRVVLGMALPLSSVMCAGAALEILAPAFLAKVAALCCGHGVFAGEAVQGWFRSAGAR
jgi:hypothetical protein